MIAGSVIHDGADAQDVAVDNPLLRMDIAMHTKLQSLLAMAESAHVREASKNINLPQLAKL